MKAYLVVPPNGSVPSFGKLSLPTHYGEKWVPGEWMTPDGEEHWWTELYGPGLLLQARPVPHWTRGSSLYTAECGPVLAQRPSVIVVKTCRLLRKVDDVSRFQIYSVGEHEVTAREAWADGLAILRVSGTAEAYLHGKVSCQARGQARVAAQDDCVVQAWESSHVAAKGHALVHAWGSAVVEASEDVRVEATDRAEVFAFGNTHVGAKGYVLVRAGGNAHVRISEGAICIVQSGTPTVLRDGGVIVDQRGGKNKAYDSGPGLPP